MVALFLRKIGLLSWKNLKVLQRHWLMTPFEVLLPLSLFLLIAWFKTYMSSSTEVVVKTPTISSILDETVLFNTFPRDTVHLYYVPSNDFTDKLMEDVRKKLSFSKQKLSSFSSELELENHFALSFENITTQSINVIGVVFNNVSQMIMPNNLNYKIRSSSVEWSTSLLFPHHQGAGPMHSSELYFRSGFLALQSVIDSCFITLLKPKDSIQVETTVQEFPYPPYVASEGSPAPFSDMLSTCTIFGFLVLCLNIVGRIVEDKHTGVTELMKLMGLSRLMLWLSWFLRAMFLNVLIISLAVFILKYTFSEQSGPVFAKSDGSVLWVFLLLFSIAVTVFMFALSTFFARPVFAMCFGAIFWLISYFVPKILINVYKQTGLVVKIFSSLLPNMAMHWGFLIFDSFEARHVGVQWSNLSKSPNRDPDDLQMYHVLVMLTVDTLLYGFITWYIDSILPGNYGVPEPWYFCLTDTYWRKGKVDTLRSSYDIDDTNLNFESPPQGLKVGIRVQDLEKTYSSGKVAVNGVTIDFYEDQITALLGHNGAGKTTTMSILTGMLPPSSGSVWINDHNIRTDLDKVRESLGLCPQHNMVFADLTVMEHLFFFGMLKGSSRHVAKESAVDLLKKLHLSDKSNWKASQLSGGMQRKLCLGIALIGDSKVVVLDEPTSGMDPESRRQIWDLLLSMRGRRTIIITTHFMEEADVLGDRIAIMDHGKVQCYGTSLFLKRQYGAGYLLKLLTREPCDVAKITQIVQSAVPSAALKTRLGSEVSYTLPLEQKSQFPNLFKAIEANKSGLGIMSIGLSLTTLEDVFLNVGNQVAEKENLTKGQDLQSSKRTTLDANSERYSKKRTVGLVLRLQQVQALFIKKIIFTRRKWFMFFVLALVAVLLTLSAFALCKVMSDLHGPTEPALPLTLNQYDSSEVLFTASSSSVAGWYEKLVVSTGSTPRSIPEKEGVSAGIISVGENDMLKYQSLVVAAEFNGTGKKLAVNALFSGLAYHSAPIALNLINNAVLKSYMDSDDYSINVINHPLESKEVATRSAANAGIMIIWQQLIPLGLLFLMGNFLVFPIAERVSNAKQLQLMTGVSPLTYWLTSFFWDLLIYFVVAIVMVLLLPIFNARGYMGGGEEMCVLLLILFLYGLSGIPYVYWFSYFSKTTASGFGIFVVVNFVIGAIFPWVISITEQILHDDATWGEIIGHIKRVLFLLPHFCLSYGLMKFAQQAVNNNVCSSMDEASKERLCMTTPGNPCCQDSFKPLSYTELDSANNSDAIGWPLIFLALDSLLYFALILLLDYGVTPSIYECLKRLKWLRQTDEDQVDGDVRTEMNRIKQCDADVLTVNDMMKVYGRNYLAVKGVSFGVMPGECFGLLGVNGAGKTTTFKMLTGAEIPTRGDAHIMNYSLSKSKAKYLSQIGYCPQFDAFNEVLTAREMLQLFARLRGINENDFQRETNKWLKEMGLLEYQDCLCGTYSGGNKRKLSTAMALIGDPPLIFLDEPTSGVDPVARRNLWSVLAKIQKTDHSIVLTSHSMDECEALCNRLAIMVKGRFVCIGENQHLKQKFGQGFTVMIKLNNIDAEADQASSVQKVFKSTFAECVLKDQHQGLLHYHVTDTRLTWSTVFAKMEALQRSCAAIEDYTISETTLEQVFLSFAQTSAK